MESHDVVIIGGGVAGLSAAARLRRKGVRDIVVLEREREAGGVPRHCGHWGFGWESHRRMMSGPAYAARLRREADDIDVRTRATVLDFISPNQMRIHTATDIQPMEARQIIIATGARESSSAARFLGGERSTSVMNTATLQQLVYLEKIKPFARPVILGGEWVSFSALMTCRHAGIKPTTMIVEEERIDAPWFFSLGARWVYGVRVMTSARLIQVSGVGEVEGVQIEQRGERQTVDCDGVIVSGRFVPEDTLFASGPLSDCRRSEDPSPALAQRKLPHLQFAGNVCGALKTAGRCAIEARAVADALGRIKP